MSFIAFVCLAILAIVPFPCHSSSVEHPSPQIKGQSKANDEVSGAMKKLNDTESQFDSCVSEAETAFSSFISAAREQTGRAKKLEKLIDLEKENSRLAGKCVSYLSQIVAKAKTAKKRKAE